MLRNGATRPDRQRPLRLPAAIWMLGFVSLFMDVSSELIHSLLPAFLVTVLGASALSVGVIEGLAESTALIVKVFSGTLSDFLGRRKGLTVLGYGLGALSKPLFALAASIDTIFLARFVDRIGKGIRGAPRDALVADLAPAELHGAAFGLRQSLDTLGAVLGPLLGIGLMLLWADDFRSVFWVAVIPAALAVGLLLFGVREPAAPPRPSGAKPIRWRALGGLGAPTWWVLGIAGLFTLARFSEAFLILRAQDNGLPLAWLPATLVVMNVVYAAAAYPFGRLSDRVSHRRLLGAGMIVLIAADLVLAWVESWPGVLLGVALWGLHLGITQGLISTMLARAAPEHLRGTAFGVLGLVTGVAMLAASVLAGLVWEVAGPEFTFLTGAGLCLLALTGLSAGGRFGLRFR
ncbi:MAG: MFS transporter [Pseudomonadales bacterium]